MKDPGVPDESTQQRDGLTEQCELLDEDRDGSEIGTVGKVEKNRDEHHDGLNEQWKSWRHREEHRDGPGKTL